jgi:hypothetical protein
MQEEFNLIYNFTKPSFAERVLASRIYYWAFDTSCGVTKAQPPEKYFSALLDTWKDRQSIVRSR